MGEERGWASSYRNSVAGRSVTPQCDWPRVAIVSLLVIQEGNHDTFHDILSRFWQSRPGKVAIATPTSFKQKNPATMTG